MKVVASHLQNIPFEEIKDCKLLCEDEQGYKFYTTFECLYKIFEKQYNDSLMKIDLLKIKNLKGY